MADSQTVTVDRETLSVTGKPPKKRVGSAALVSAIVDRYKSDDRVRGEKRARIDRQLAGNRPFNPEYLEKTGQADRSNVPFREAEGHVAARLTTYFNLIFEPPCLVTVKLKDAKLADHDYAGIIAEKFHDMLMEWPGFVFNVLLHQLQMVVHAVGPVYFPDELDWHFKALRHGSFLVNVASDSTIDTLPDCVIRGKYKAHELFWKIAATEDEITKGITDEMKRKTAEEHGWNVDLVRKLIVKSNTQQTLNKDDRYQTSTWESIEQEIKNGDVTYSNAFSDDIHVAHFFQREYRGGVSWYIIPENYEQPQFLYQSGNQFKDFREIICLFFCGIGDGSYHSVQGMGKKIFSHSVINDRLRNSLIDAADLKGKLLVKGDVSDQRKIKIGRVVIIPNNVTIVADGFNPDIKGIFTVMESLEQSLARNVGTERPDLNDHGLGGEEKVGTALGERLRVSREGKLERSEIMLYYLQCDALYREIKRRVLLEGLGPQDSAYESVEKFKQECIDAGVPKALLKDDAWSIKASRAVGFGSPAQAREIWETVVSMADHYPEVGKMRAVKRYLVSLIGAAMSEEIFPETDMAQDPSNQESFAVMENSIMMLGENVVVGKDQMHLVHLNVHFEPMDQIDKQFVSTGGVGDNPMKTHDFFMEDLYHSAQHLDYIKNDSTRQSEYKKFMAHFDELLKVFRAIDTMVKKLQQQLDQQRQKQQPQVDPEIALKEKKQADMVELAREKEAHMQQIREQKTESILGLTTAKANQKMVLEQRKAKTT